VFPENPDELPCTFWWLWLLEVSCQPRNPIWCWWFTFVSVVDQRESAYDVWRWTIIVHCEQPYFSNITSHVHALSPWNWCQKAYYAGSREINRARWSKRIEHDSACSWIIHVNGFQQAYDSKSREKNRALRASKRIEYHNGCFCILHVQRISASIQRLKKRKR